MRRLVSEGSRPLLPWGGNLTELLEPPHPTLALLEKLHRDPSDYVRLSVANHLNDFSKHHPALVIATLTRWRDANPDDPRLAKLARHACRTLLKAGHAEALEFHGYGAAKSLELEVFELAETTVKTGGSLGYRMILRNASRRPLKVMFDYAIHHRKANGSLSPKVFKGRVRELAPGEVMGNHRPPFLQARHHPRLSSRHPPLRAADQRQGVSGEGVCVGMMDYRQFPLSCGLQRHAVIRVSCLLPFRGELRRQAPKDQRSDDKPAQGKRGTSAALGPLSGDSLSPDGAS